MAKKTIRLTESDIHRIVKESVQNIILEKVKAKKLQQLADEHGGFDNSYFKNGGGVGSPYRGYVSEMPDEFVLGVGGVDLHTYPHQNFEINGVSDEDMEQLRLRDGQYLYFNKKAFYEKFGDRIKAKRQNNDIPDGAFKYVGKNSKDIEQKKYFSRFDPGQKRVFRDTYKNNITQIIELINSLNKLEKLDAVTNIKGSVENAKNALYDVIDKLKEADNNLTDNLPNSSVDRGGHYWRPEQPINVTKTMKARDSRKPNLGGRTDSFYDVQGGGIWGHDNKHPNTYGGQYPYR